MNFHNKLRLTALTVISAVGPVVYGQGFFTTEPAQIAPSANTVPGWQVQPLVTIGEQDGSGNSVNLANFGYEIPGIPDGMAAYRVNNRTRLFVSHEFSDNSGTPYTLANGTVLTGARISAIDLKAINRRVVAAGPAYDQIFDRYGVAVTSADQISEGEGGTTGIDRLCSGWGAEGGEYGLLDPMYFTGEESSPPFDARGGAEFVLDVKRNILYCAPMLGRAAWESMAGVENYGTDKVVLLGGDDRGGAPLILYVGERNSVPAGSYSPGSFLVRNGMGNGNFYVWVSDEFAVTGEIDPTTFRGTGNSRSGKFVKIAHYDPAMASQPGYDNVGFADITTQDALATAVGFFRFSRPEDVSANPADATQVVMASTGRSTLFGGVDSWGTMYLIDFDDADLMAQLAQPLSSIDNIKADLNVLYDGDDAGAGQFAGPDYGLRSPDNLVWANNGQIYVQEDKSFSSFGLTSGAESSMWSLDPSNGLLERVLEMDRSAIPAGQTDGSPSDIGNWENSGVIDVTNLFATLPGETLLILNVEAHALNGGLIGGSDSLVEGGQILMARTRTSLPARLAAPVAELSVFPNPATDYAQLQYTLTEAGNIDLTVWDLQGRLVKTLIHADRAAGVYTFQIPTADLPVGQYLIQLNAGSLQATQQLTVIR